MGVTRFAHVGVVAEDLDAMAEFLTALGFACGERWRVGGELVERVIGVREPRAEAFMARTPDGSGEIEVARFVAPTDGGSADPAAPSNRPGIRHLCYQDDDVRATVERARALGYDTVGDVVDYEGTYLLCYVRGPEGLIVELAQPLR